MSRRIRHYSVLSLAVPHATLGQSREGDGPSADYQEADSHELLAALETGSDDCLRGSSDQRLAGIGPLREREDLKNLKPVKVNVKFSNGQSIFVKLSSRQYLELQQWAETRGGTLEEAFVDLLRIGLMVSHAVEVLGTSEKAFSWLESPNRDLHGAVPYSLLSSLGGTKLIDAVLTRIDHEVFS